MQLAAIRTLFDFDALRGKISDQADRLTPEQYEEPTGRAAEYPPDSDAHVLIAQHLWRVRCETGRTEVAIGPDDFPTVAAYRAGWAAERRRLDAYLAGLDDDAPGRPLRFARRGETHAVYPLACPFPGDQSQHAAPVGVGRAG
ncbi:MAG: hypothetical protein U0232_03900 [Thermomicrobiales bacterium]